MKRVLTFYFLLSIVTTQPLYAQEALLASPEPSSVTTTEPSAAPVPSPELSASQSEIKVEPDPQPTPDATASPTPTPTPSALPTPSATPLATASPAPSPSPTLAPVIVAATESQDTSTQLVSATTSAQLNSDNTTEATESATKSTDSPPEQEHQESSSQSITQQVSNKATSTATASQHNNTGENTVDSQQSAVVNTGDATAAASITHELNTTAIGENFHYGSDIITSNYGPLDLSSIERRCLNPALPTSIPTTSEITITNDAQIDNNLDLSASTGANNLSGTDNELTTGDAAATAQVANIANTSLVGDCWLFHTITIFSPYTFSIILPNEDQFISGGQTDALPPTNLDTTITNDASINEEVQADATTGNNETAGGSTSTGAVTHQVESVTQANTNIIGDTWLLFKIINPQYWKGSFLNGYQPSYQDATAVYYWLPSSYLSGGLSTGSQPPSYSTNKVTVNNSAAINTSISLLANTGDNSATGGNSTINTGTARTDAEIFNLLNTTIIGNNWYFVLLTLFDEFSGDISFARPDISLISVPSFSASPGTTVNFNLGVINQGNSSAADIIITESVSFTGHQPASWRLAELAPNASAIVPLSITIPTDLADGKYFITYTANSPYTEDVVENNSYTVALTVKSHSVTPTSLTTTVPKKLPIKRVQQLVPRTQVKRLAPARHIFSKQQHSQILGAAQPKEEIRSLSVALPKGFGGPFCLKHWDVCSAAGILVTTMPLRALERRRLLLLARI